MIEVLLVYDLFLVIEEYSKTAMSSSWVNLAVFLHLAVYPR